MVFNQVNQDVLKNEEPVAKTGKYVIIISPLNGERSFRYRDPKTNKPVSFQTYTEAVMFGHDLCEHRMWTFDVNYIGPR